MNTFDDVEWFNKERFDLWLKGLFLVAVVDLVMTAEDQAPRDVARAITDGKDLIQRWKKAETVSEYRVADLLNALQPRKPRKK